MSRKLLTQKNVLIFAALITIVLVVLFLTGKLHRKSSNVKPPVGGCAGTLAGCCDDNVTQCDCSKPRPSGCENCNC